jgi:hypothetical protein
MDINLIENYVYTTKLDLNLAGIKDSTQKIYDLVKKEWSDCGKDFTGQSTLTTQVYTRYNLLMYPLFGFHDLYKGIQQTFRTIAETDEPHYIQCWLNVYNKGDYIQWHHHFPPNARSWHGFFCVDTEPGSYTSYRIPHLANEVNIPSEDNLIVISRSAGDEHKSSEWPFADRPRITIAFDILPQNNIWWNQWLNHWIPI